MPYLVARDRPTNYNLFLLIVPCIWIAPFYALDRNVMHISVYEPPGYYMWWYNLGTFIMSLIAFVVVIKLLEVLCEKYLPQEKKPLLSHYIMIGAALWLLSPLTYFTIAMGQTDLLENMLAMCAVIFLMEKKILPAGFMISLALSIKGLSLFVLVLILLLMFRVYKERIVPFFAAILSFPLLFRFIEKFIMVDYYAVKKEMEMEWGHMRSVVDLDYHWINAFLVTMVVVCAICLAKGVINNGEHVTFAESCILIVLPMIVFVICVRWHPQWLIYMSLPLLLVCGQIGNRLWALLVHAGIGLRNPVFVFLALQENVDNNMFRNAMNGLMEDRDVKRHIADIVFKRTAFGGDLSMSIFIGSMLAAVVLLYLKEKGQLTEMKDNRILRVTEGILAMGIVAEPLAFFYVSAKYYFWQ